MNNCSNCCCYTWLYHTLFGEETNDDNFAEMENAKKVNVGSWGAFSGGFWSYEPKGIISQLSITHDDYIQTITFTSIDENGNSISSKYGSSDGSIKVEINIPEDEKLTGLSGTFGPTAEAAFLRSLTFYTNKKKPLKTVGNVSIGKAFSYLAAGNDDSIVGFFGRAGSLIDGIGIFVQPKPTIRITPWGGNGGRTWNYKPKGLISGITITYSENGIYSIVFKSKDGDHKEEMSDTFGSEGPKKVEIVIDTAVEKVNFISGTYGEKGSELSYVNSLKFITSTGKNYGPYGNDPKGTSFSLPVNQGYFAGFHGHCGKLLDSIGVHLNS